MSIVKTVMEFKELVFNPNPDESCNECDFCYRGEFSLILENPASGQMLKMYQDADGDNIWCEDCKENCDAVIAEHPVIEIKRDES